MYLVIYKHLAGNKTQENCAKKMVDPGKLPGPCWLPNPAEFTAFQLPRKLEELSQDLLHFELGFADLGGPLVDSMQAS